MKTWASLGASLGIIARTTRSAGDTEYFCLIKHITSCNSLQQCTRNGCSTRTSGQTQQFRYGTSQRITYQRGSHASVLRGLSAMLSASFVEARWRSPVTRLLRNSADLGQTGLHKSTCEDQDPRRKLRWHAGRRRLRGVTRGTLTAGRTGGQRGRGSQLDGGGRLGGPGRARSGEDGTRRGRTAA